MACFAGPEIVNYGLVLHLDAANERSYSGSGTTWFDLSGNGNDGTLVNGVGYSVDNQGSIVFDGVNEYVNIQSSSTNNITGDNITLEVVYNAKALANGTHGDGLISKGSGSNDGQYEILLLPVGSHNKAFFRCYGVGTYDPGSVLMNLNQDYVITCVLQNKFMKIYVNGNQDGLGAQKNGSIVSRSQPITLGVRQRHSGGSESAFEGTIYSAKIYNRALTEAEIKQNFEAIRSRYGI